MRLSSPSPSASVDCRYLVSGFCPLFSGPARHLCLLHHLLFWDGPDHPSSPSLRSTWWGRVVGPSPAAPRPVVAGTLCGGGARPPDRQVDPPKETKCSCADPVRRPSVDADELVAVLEDFDD